jgi:hypothetical protein
LLEHYGAAGKWAQAAAIVPAEVQYVLRAAEIFERQGVPQG